MLYFSLYTQKKRLYSYYKNEGSVEQSSLVVGIPLFIGCVNTLLVINWLVMYGGDSHYSGLFYKFGGGHILLLLIPTSIGSIAFSAIN